MLEKQFVPLIFNFCDVKMGMCTEEKNCLTELGTSSVKLANPEAFVKFEIREKSYIFYFMLLKID